MLSCAKNLCLLRLVFAVIVGVLATAAAQARPASDSKAKVPDLSKHVRIMPAIGKALEDLHYKRSKLDNAKSKKILETFVGRLDPNKVYLTKHDVESLQEKYGALLDNAVRMGDVRPSLDIFGLYRQRALDRMQKNLGLLEKDYDFEGDIKVRLNRKASGYEPDMQALDAMWEARVEAELLHEHLAEEERDPKEVLRTRYTQIAQTVEKMRPEEVGDLFLTSVMKAYDPHSEYLSADDMENFDISMRLSLVGIGAVLKQEDDKVTIVEVVPGGPADVDGRLKPKDRVLSVAQGDKPPVDVVGMRVDDVVKLIRGEKGTKVTLTVEPAADRALRLDVDLTREVVRLTDAEARAEVIELGAEGKKIGWITLPSFYANLGGAGPTKSVTQDVALLLKRLNHEGIDGLVVDLRRDAGGSLDEAIDLTGLFIDKGPVVQSKDAKGNILVSKDKNPKVAYMGPMVVLVNRLSASASEIFAAALQDYGRALIVGDSKTFGKGTVQTVLDLGRVMAYLGVGIKNPGSLKLTVQQFYRVTGESIQLSGVASDIVLPSLSDTPELSEEENPNRMGPDAVPPTSFDSWQLGLDVDMLRSLSAERVQEDREFGYVRDDKDRLQQRLSENTLSTSRAVRLREKAEDAAREEQRTKLRAEKPDTFAPKVRLLTVQAAKTGGDFEELDYLAAEQRGKGKLDMPQKESGADKLVADPVKKETLKIMADIIDMSNAKLAAAGPASGPDDATRVKKD